jgi:hypothetical protein
VHLPTAEPRLRRGAIAIGVYAQERPFFFHLPKSSSYGLARGIDHLDGRADRRLQEGVRGALGNDDMQAVHERLHWVLSLDLSRAITAT